MSRSVIAGLLLLVSSLSWGGQAALTWTAPPTNVDGTPTNVTGYRVYQRCPPAAVAQVTELPSLAYTIANIPDDGRTCYFSVSAYDVTGESIHSNEVSKVFLAPTTSNPSAPVITTITWAQETGNPPSMASYIQGAVNGSGGATTITLAAPATAGNLLVLLYRNGGSAAAITNVDDDVGVTADWEHQQGNTWFSAGAYYGVVSKIAAGGENTVTWSTTGGEFATLMEIQGPTTRTAYAVTNTEPTSGTNQTVSATVSGATVAIGWVGSESGITVTAGAGWTQPTDNSQPSARTGNFYDLAPSAGSRTFDEVRSASSNAGIVILLWAAGSAATKTNLTTLGVGN